MQRLLTLRMGKLQIKHSTVAFDHCQTVKFAPGITINLGGAAFTL